ncbi:hypothetical protein [Arcanobacterium pinnipediorum]|uniref:PrgI family protein n=1 Tax=Arcanobacterium pinnipediorum TaxID=1503041 RepID=A0ABY5AKZ5_9ACTO|nr:hypothetical protein [Arcanobacterium pinnipediorum]USR79883.1 hypothetical protein NG665_02555 [Arcanobacterium pinnipediorum]
MSNYDVFEKAVKNKFSKIENAPKPRQDDHFLTEKDLTAEERQYLRYAHLKPMKVEAAPLAFSMVAAVFAAYKLDTRSLDVWIVVLLGVLVLIACAPAAYQAVFLPFREKVSDATSRIIHYRMTGEFDC